MVGGRTPEERLTDLEADRDAAVARADDLEARIQAIEQTDATVSLRDELQRGRVKGVQPTLDRELQDLLEWFRAERRKAAIR